MNLLLIMVMVAVVNATNYDNRRIHQSESKSRFKFEKRSEDRRKVQQMKRNRVKTSPWFGYNGQLEKAVPSKLDTSEIGRTDRRKTIETRPLRGYSQELQSEKTNTLAQVTDSHFRNGKRGLRNGKRTQVTESRNSNYNNKVSKARFQRPIRKRTSVRYGKPKSMPGYRRQMNKLVPSGYDTTEIKSRYQSSNDNAVPFSWKFNRKSTNSRRQKQGERKPRNYYHSPKIESQFATQITNRRPSGYGQIDMEIKHNSLKNNVVFSPSGFVPVRNTIAYKRQSQEKKPTEFDSHETDSRYRRVNTEPVPSGNNRSPPEIRFKHNLRNNFMPSSSEYVPALNTIGYESQMHGNMPKDYDSPKTDSQYRRLNTEHVPSGHYQADIIFKHNLIPSSFGYVPARKTTDYRGQIHKKSPTEYDGRKIDSRYRMLNTNRQTSGYGQTEMELKNNTMKKNLVSSYYGYYVPAENNIAYRKRIHEKKPTEYDSHRTDTRYGRLTSKRVPSGYGQTEIGVKQNNLFSTSSRYVPARNTIDYIEEIHQLKPTEDNEEDMILGFSGQITGYGQGEMEVMPEKQTYNTVPVSSSELSQAPTYSGYGKQVTDGKLTAYGAMNIPPRHKEQMTQSTLEGYDPVAMKSKYGKQNSISTPMYSRFPKPSDSEYETQMGTRHLADPDEDCEMPTTEHMPDGYRPQEMSGRHNILRNTLIPVPSIYSDAASNVGSEKRTPERQLSEYDEPRMPPVFAIQVTERVPTSIQEMSDDVPMYPELSQGSPNYRLQNHVDDRMNHDTNGESHFASGYIMQMSEHVPKVYVPSEMKFQHESPVVSDTSSSRTSKTSNKKEIGEESTMNQRLVMDMKVLP